MIKLSTIKKNPDNPRVIKDEAFEKLCKSIDQFPKMMSLRPIVVDGNNVVLGGNMRLTALRHLGFKEVPDQWIKQAAELTEEEKQRFIIADNVGFGSWDWDILANEWDASQLNDWGLDVPIFETETLEAKEDNYEEPEQMQVDVVSGDLIEIGQHRLICGDCTDVNLVAKLMNGDKADILFTSPPYNLGKSVSLRRGGETDNAYQDYKDDKTEQSYFDLLKGFTNSFFGYCQYLIVNIQSLAGNKKTIIDYQFEYRNFFADVAIWTKSNPPPSMAKKVMNNAFEYLFFLSTEENPSRAIKTANFHGTFSNVFFGTVNSENKNSNIHKAAFPLSMCSEFLKNFSSKSVIDCFCGTGTTMVAAHQLNRKCYGMELDPKYCQVIIDRMLKLDNTLTVKINGKKYTPKQEETPF